MDKTIQPVLSGTAGESIELGDKISFDTALKIINRIRTKSIPENSCFKYIYTHMDYVAQTNQYAPAASNEIGTISIRPNFLQNACMKCNKNCNTTKEMAMTCAKNIQTGCCRDDFMQDIVGSVLFREHYTKKK